VFILKEDKVVYFDTLMQVFILNNLAREKCTKIVQWLSCPAGVANKRVNGRSTVSRSRNGKPLACEMSAIQRRSGVRLESGHPRKDDPAVWDRVPAGGADGERRFHCGGKTGIAQVVDFK